MRPHSLTLEAATHSFQVETVTFLRRYQDLANTHRLTNKERVRTITRYVWSELRDLWQLLDGYNMLSG